MMDLFWLVGGGDGHGSTDNKDQSESMEHCWEEEEEWQLWAAIGLEVGK